MRITRDALIKAARDVINQRSQSNRDMVAVYVVGSLLTEEPLLGGTADIDLIIVENHAPARPREVIRLTTEITIDIAYHDELDYKQPRHLRLNPWVGSSLCETRLPLYDTNHWFEFTQSSVEAQFYDPENILARSRQQCEKARSLWMGLTSSAESHAQNLLTYFKSLELAANAIASLSGSPLTERRFLINFSERAEAIGHPGLSKGLAGLLGADLVEPDQIHAWLPEWHKALTSLGGSVLVPIKLHQSRIPYYERAIEAMVNGDLYTASIWPLLQTWTLACHTLKSHSPCLNDWMEACNQLHLGPEHLSERLSALDSYLDSIEEDLDKWGQDNGI